MENEHHYELRSSSRSRSTTPQVINQTVVDPEATEHNYDLRRRSRERSYTPGEVSSSRRSSSRTLPANTTKHVEQNMSTITERPDETFVQNEFENQNENQENSALRKPERRSERQRVKRQTVSNGQSEIKENAANAKMERKRKSVTPKKTLTSDYSSEDGEREDPPSRPGSAYEIYKKAGEWWNVFPKTDYTYSRTSQCRYEIAPGVLAMPNMSRRSIHSDCSSTHGSSISNSQQSLNLETGEHSGGGDIADISSIKQETMAREDTSRLFNAHTSDVTGRSIIYKQTHFEEHRAHRKILYDFNSLSPIGSPEDRYKINKSFLARKYGNTLQADSDTELDEAITKSTRVKSSWKSRISNTFSTFMSIITTIFYGTLYITTFGMFQKKESVTSHHYQYHESKLSRLWKLVDHGFQNVYNLLIRIMLLDTWLLSRASNVRRHVQGRFKKLLWIILLPLFLLAGAYIMQKYTLTCLDYLKSFQNGVTETTQSVVDKIHNLTFVDYDLFIKYLTFYKNISIPSVNVSLPSLPNIGWNIPE